MTGDEIERIRARLDTADALDPREGGRVGRTLLAALDEARAERDRLREHVAALQRCLGERSPDEPVSYAQAVGAAMREAITSERDRARREAIEACVALCEEYERYLREQGPTCRAAANAVDDCATGMRVRFLGAPTPINPATCAHDREVLGGTCSNCAAPIAINGHRPGCHASGLGPPMRIGDVGFTGCGCEPTETR